MTLALRPGHRLPPSPRTPTHNHIKWRWEKQGKNCDVVRLATTLFEQHLHTRTSTPRITLIAKGYGYQHGRRGMNNTCGHAIGTHRTPPISAVAHDSAHTPSRTLCPNPCTSTHTHTTCGQQCPRGKVSVHGEKRRVSG